MIKSPCEKCSEAYGHNGNCPLLIKDADEQITANADWTRGYNAAEARLSDKPEDTKNEVYKLGRKVYELESSGRLPKRRSRAVRAPIKSEPRMAAVSSLRVDT